MLYCLLEVLLSCIPLASVARYCNNFCLVLHVRLVSLHLLYESVCVVILSLLEEIKNLSIYSEVQYYVKLQSGLSDPFIANIGVKHGCILSPLLFNLFVNDLPKCFEKEKYATIAFGDLYVNCLMNADGIVLLSESKEGLQNCLSSLQNYGDLWRSNINTETSKVIIFNKRGKLKKKKERFFLTTMYR